ncbi:MAG: hypothetical protein RJA77_1205 [Pseudomonadota bacterium]
MVPGYVLHGLAWRETSLVLEVFSREEGRLGVVARGARRPRSALRGLLQPFQPVLLRYSSKGDLRTLLSAEWRAGLPAFRGEALLAGFYLNELVIRLLPRHDPHPNLYDAYEQALQALSADQGGARLALTEAVLRQFECRLLREMGVAPDFFPAHVRDAPDALYCVSPHEGVHPAGASVRSMDAIEVTGHTLMALSRYDQDLAAFSEGFVTSEWAGQAKRLLRGLIRHQLGGEDLASREAVRALAQIQRGSHD